VQPNAARQLIEHACGSLPLAISFFFYPRAALETCRQLTKIPAVLGVLAFAAALEGLMAIASEKHRQWGSMTMRR
jgi:hypothetical protein